MNRFDPQQGSLASAYDELVRLVKAAKETPWDEAAIRGSLLRIKGAGKEMANAQCRPLWGQLGRQWAEQGDVRPFLLLAWAFPPPRTDRPSAKEKSYSAIRVLVSEALSVALAKDDLALLNHLVLPQLFLTHRELDAWLLCQAALEPVPPPQILTALARRWSTREQGEHEKPYRLLCQQAASPQDARQGLEVLAPWVSSQHGPEFWSACMISTQAVQGTTWAMNEVGKAFGPVVSDTLLRGVHDFADYAEASLTRLWHLTDGLLGWASADLQRKWLAEQPDQLPQTVTRLCALDRNAELALRPSTSSRLRRRA